MTDPRRPRATPGSVVEVSAEAGSGAGVRGGGRAGGVSLCGAGGGGRV
jgi:hypothetical protein